MKKALITGVTGQDGAYLAEYLLKENYEVHGLKRRSSLFNTDRIDHIYEDPHIDNQRFFLHFGDLTDSTNLISVINKVHPDEIYNLAAQSHVQVSFETPEYTANSDALGTLRILEAIRILNLEKHIRFYQASTSELYGKVVESPQNEKTPFYPRSPYAAAKLYSYWITRNYREAYGIFASNGILFNHESPLRGETFVTRKITRAAARIYFGLQNKLYLGNLNAQRDWGHAKDFVRSMHLILNHKEPDDFVIATGVTTSIRDFVLEVFSRLDIKLEFIGSDLEEKGIVVNAPSSMNIKKGDVLIEVDSRYFRPSEVDVLMGDSSKAKNILGWKPKYNLSDLIDEMISHDIKLVEKDDYLRKGNYTFNNYFE